MSEIAKIGKVNLNEDNDRLTISKKMSPIEHPFQKVLDSVVDSLNKTSQSDKTADNLAMQYVDGQVSLEEAMFAQQKATLEINTTVTAVNNAMNAFKEILQTPL